MKKISITILALLLILAIASPVVAASLTIDENTTSQGTSLTYTVGNSYTVTIPPSVTLTSGNGNGTISVSKALIPFGQNLKVKISNSLNYTDSKFYLKDTTPLSTSKLEYNIKAGPTTGDTDVAFDAAFVTIAAGSLSEEGFTTKLFYSVVGTPTTSGSYTDTLTFTVYVE